jgi:hypothetical protein
MVRTAGRDTPARSASWRDAIEHRAFSLLFLLGALVMAVSTTGCSLTGSGPTDTTLSGGSTTVTGGATAATSFVETQPSTEALLRAELVLADATGVDVSTVHIAAGQPSSPGATVVLEWEGGRAEVDADSGIVYAASATRPPADTFSEYMSEDRLRMESLQLVRDLGWTDGTLAGLGFKQVEPGVLAGDTGVYTIVWTQYDDKGRVQDGSIVLKVDGRTGLMVGFSAWPGRNAPDIAGVISEADALLVAQMTIYLRTDKPKLSLAGDGSLILINRAVWEELKTVKDSKIVAKPRLCWVVTILGTVDLQLVGGTVYLDAKTGEVLKYQAYKTSEPVTTTSSLE